MRIRFATVSKTLSGFVVGSVFVLFAVLLVFFGQEVFSSRLPARPQASGAVGAVHVHGQNDSGAFRLFPGRVSVLKRPQHLAFELQLEGEGPRSIYIELEAGAQKWRMFNDRVQGPKTNWYLEYVMKLGDNVPNTIQVIVRVDAPHAKAVESRFPIRLTRKRAP